MTQASEVNDLLIYFSQKKADFKEGEITDFESQYVNTYRLTADGVINPVALHYKEAFGSYLNKIL